MTVSVYEFVNKALKMKGKPYIFGAEASPLDPDPDALDCSELVEWACGALEVSPRVPDGAFYQWRHTRNHGLAMSVRDGIRTYGALLFMGDGTGVGRDAITHVAISLGNGLTIEARGRAWGVGTWSAERGFDFAGRIPGVDYTKTTPTPDPRIPIQLKYGRGDHGPHVNFARAMLNIVQKYRKGRKIAMTGPVDDEFLAAVKEFQVFCGQFLTYTTGNPGVFHTPTGLMGPATTNALSDWVAQALK